MIWPCIVPLFFFFKQKSYECSCFQMIPQDPFLNLAINLVQIQGLFYEFIISTEKKPVHTPKGSAYSELQFLFCTVLVFLQTRTNTLIKTLSPAKQANGVKALLFLASLGFFFFFVPLKLLGWIFIKFSKLKSSLNAVQWRQHSQVLWGFLSVESMTCGLTLEE